MIPIFDEQDIEMISEDEDYDIHFIPRDDPAKSTSDIVRERSK